MKKDLWFAVVSSIIVLSVLISSSAAFVDAGSWIPDLPAYGEVGHYMTFPEAFWWNFQNVFIMIGLFSLFIIGLVQFAYYSVKATRDFMEENA